MDYYILYRDRNNHWRWQYRHRNGNVIADSGEGYVNRTDALNGINIMKLSANVQIHEQ